MPRKWVAGKTGASDIGLFAATVDRVFDHPVSVGGVFAMALTIAAIVGNALFLQPGTVDGRSVGPGAAESAVPVDDRQDLTSIISEAVPVPRSRVDLARSVEDTTITASVPTVTPPPAAPPYLPPADIAVAPALPPEPAPPVAASPEPATVQLVEIQRALARLGIYSGAIDGLVGPRTRAAIVQYQTAAGVEITGEASGALLELLRAPIPTTGSETAIAETEQSVTATETARAQLAELEQRSADLARRDRTMEVQAALNKIGYGPLTVDGEAGPDTQNAIRQFELDHGLDITGSANDQLVRRLVDIGALDAAG